MTNTHKKSNYYLILSDYRLALCDVYKYTASVHTRQMIHLYDEAGLPW